jgi:hypothetical protein
MVYTGVHANSMAARQKRNIELTMGRGGEQQLEEDVVYVIYVTF